MMNPGTDVTMEIDGTPYTLSMGTNSMILLEDLFSTPERPVSLGEIIDQLQKGSVRHIRGFFWAALQKKHPSVSIEAAGDLIEQAGGFVEFTKKVEQLTVDSGAAGTLHKRKRTVK